ncbi:MAG: DUF2306 domain-containing protein [Gemmatimonadaceae bacterium]|nr:DUF2306 domain-containing protein [Gemmatimonadaceae bacterium]
MPADPVIAVTVPGSHRAPDPAARLLRRTGTAFVVAAVTGQLAFAVYVALYYGGRAAAGDLAGWNRAMPHGHIPGDTVGNAAMSLHLLLAVAMIACGAVQLSPAVRRRWPRVHRLSGRVFALAAAVLAIGGLWLVWVRGSVGGIGQHLGVSANALVILACAWFAVSRARARRMAEHRVPLAVCEAWLRAERGATTWQRRAMAATLALATLIVVAGTGVLVLVRWGPLLRAG